MNFEREADPVSDECPRRARVMSSISVTAVVILVLVSLAALAQEPGDMLRNANIRPSGYIDFYGMPSPPDVPAADTKLHSLQSAKR
jgi:hypothetical protein